MFTDLYSRERQGGRGEGGRGKGGGREGGRGREGGGRGGEREGNIIVPIRKCRYS